MTKLTHNILAVTIPKKIESADKWVWKPWYIYDKYKKSWFKFLALYAPVMKGIPNGKRRVVITGRRKREIDYNNFVGGCKPILDYLKKTFYIRDDSPVWVEVEYNQEVCDNEETEIHVFKCQHDEEEDFRRPSRMIMLPTRESQGDHSKTHLKRG